MKERAGEEKKEENRKLDLIIERHALMIPKVQETLVKTECYWKCYSYGDDLIPIFEFIERIMVAHKQNMINKELILLKVSISIITEITCALQDQKG